MPSKAPTVVVIAPDPAVRGIMGQLLQSFGLRVVEGVHGDEAVELALLGRADAVIFFEAKDTTAALLVSHIRDGGAVTGIVCCLAEDHPDRLTIRQDSRTRIMSKTPTLRNTVQALQSVSPICDRAIAAKRARKAAA